MGNDPSDPIFLAREAGRSRSSGACVDRSASGAYRSPRKTSRLRFSFYVLLVSTNLASSLASRTGFHIGRNGGGGISPLAGISPDTGRRRRRPLKTETTS